MAEKRKAESSTPKRMIDVNVASGSRRSSQTAERLARESNYQRQIGK